MATKIGDLYFDVSASTEKINKSIAGIGSAAQGAGGIISTAIGGSFVAAGIAATTTLLGIGAAVAAVGAEFNSASQKATGLFTALTGSAEEAVALMQEFAEISLDTPIFSAKALQDVSRTLLAYGVAKDDVIDMAVAIQSTATALGIGELGAHKLALALGQVQSRGFFSAEEARQLANYGVNAYQLIADAVGLSVAEVRALGKEHRLLSEDVMPILTDKLQETFGPVAQNLLNTYGVQVQGLKNTLIGVSSALVQPFIGATGGGAVVEFLQRIRSEIDGVVKNEDGVYQLTGALGGLYDVSQALADGFTELGNSFIDWITSVGSGGGLESLTESVADAIPGIVNTIQSLASGTVDFLSDMGTAIQPLIPDLQHLAAVLYTIVTEGLPVAAEAVVNFTEAAAIAAHEIYEMAKPIIEAAVPALEALLFALVEITQILAELAPYIKDIIALWLGFKAAIIIAEVATATSVAITFSPLVAVLSAIVVQAGLAVTALGLLKAVEAGVKGDNDFLTDDVPWYMKFPQKLGQLGFEATGDLDQLKATAAQNALLEEGKAIGDAFAESMAESGLSMDEFSAAATASLPTIEAVNFALIAYKATLDSFMVASLVKNLADAKINIMGTADAWKASAERAKEFNLGQEETLDVLEEIKDAAKEAADALDEFLKPTAEATIDDFFRSLPGIIEDVTDAMAMAEGPLKNLALGGALDDAKDTALKVIDDLVDNYGLSLAEIEAMFDERGLAGVIEAMGNITKETTKTVDPLIAKYASLGATADQLGDAIRKLNDQRQTAIKAQIDQVSAALRDAKIAAEEAKKAFDDYFLGGTGGLQGAIDKLVLDIPNIGDSIEAGLLKGGPQGEATIRQALSGAGSALGSIFQMGMEQGLSADQIMGMLGPVYGSIQQELSGALNRISSLDWTEGFTPGAASQIQSWFAGILDPTQIGQLFANVLGSDRAVSGLEKQLEDLQAAASVDVEFSEAQVRGALDELTAEAKTLEVEVVTTPEAAQLVYDQIKDLFLDPTNELATLIDKQNLANQVMDAAEEGAKQTHLIFDAGLSFNQAGLSQAAQDAAATFINEFNAAQRQILDQYAQSQGFENYGAMQTALGPVVTGAMAPNVPFIATVNLNQNLTSGGIVQPPISSVTTIAANSAGAGTNGTITRTLQEIYGDDYVVRGRTGAQ